MLVPFKKSQNSKYYEVEIGKLDKLYKLQEDKHNTKGTFDT